MLAWNSGFAHDCHFAPWQEASDEVNKHRRCAWPSQKAVSTVFAHDTGGWGDRDFGHPLATTSVRRSLVVFPGTVPVTEMWSGRSVCRTTFLGTEVGRRRGAGLRLYTEP